MLKSNSSQFCKVDAGQSYINFWPIWFNFQSFKSWLIRLKESLKKIPRLWCHSLSIVFFYFELVYFHIWSCNKCIDMSVKCEFYSYFRIVNRLSIALTTQLLYSEIIWFAKLKAILETIHEIQLISFWYNYFSKWMSP